MLKKKKIGLVGAGNIGGNVASIMSRLDGVSVVLQDINEGVAKGKALDIGQMNAAMGVDGDVLGTAQMSDLKDSDVVIVTAGLPRGPNMTRGDLLQTNAEIIRSVAKEIKRYAANAFCIVVTNPLDAMVHEFCRIGDFPKNMVVGMAGTLDTARFKYFLAQEFGVSMANVVAMVLGGHGDAMVPLVSGANVSGVGVLEMVKMGMSTPERLDDIVARTRNGGGEIVSLLGNGSAFYAPAFCAAEIAQSFLFDQKKLLPVCANVGGEYGISELFFGVPVIIGAGGVEMVVQLELSKDESEMLRVSVESVCELLKGL
jgi:malate dehydrogenase